MSQDTRRDRALAREAHDAYLRRCMEQVAEAKPLPWVTAEDIEAIQADAREESNVYYVNDVASAERTTMPAEQFDAMFNALDTKPDGYELTGCDEKCDCDDRNESATDDARAERWGEGDEVDLMERIQWAEVEAEELREDMNAAYDACDKLKVERDQARQALAEAVKAGFEAEDKLANMDEKYRAKMKHSHGLWDLLKRQTREVIALREELDRDTDFWIGQVEELHVELNEANDDIDELVEVLKNGRQHSKWDDVKARLLRKKGN